MLIIFHTATWHEVKKKITCWKVDLAVPADPRVKNKESKKREKYLDAAKGLKYQWNMKVTVTANIITRLEPF